MKIYRCNTCGNIFATIEDKGVNPVCCAHTMELLIPEKVDTLMEKHVPVIIRKGNQVTVTISDTLHPMDKEHYIKWIILETNHGFMTAHLKPGDMPAAAFLLKDKELPLAAYAYCNIHNLWMSEAKPVIEITMEEAECCCC